MKTHYVFSSGAMVYCKNQQPRSGSFGKVKPIFCSFCNTTRGNL